MSCCPPCARVGDQDRPSAALTSGRDRHIIELVWNHRVLTTDHIRDLVFGDHGHVRRRLVTLHRLMILDRFRPLRTTGSAPFHYVLGPAGAAVLAAERGIDVRDLGYRRDKILAIAHNQRLAHIVGVNGFLRRPGRRSRPIPRTGAGAALSCHLGRHRPPRRLRPLARTRPRGRLFLEYDRDTEPLQRVAAKIDAYADLLDITGIPTPILFWLPTHGREVALRKLLPRSPVPTATAVQTLGHSPADAVWPAVGSADDARRRLVLIDC